MIEIHNQCAIEFMGTLGDGEIDLAVYDPPYKVISGGSNEGKSNVWDRPGGVLTKNDGKIFAHNEITPDDYLDELFRVMRDQSHVYMMTNTLGLVNGVLESVQRHGFKIHNLLPWVKNNATPNRWYMKNVEYTIFMRKGKAFAINDKSAKTAMQFPYPLDWDNVKSPKPHPTAKPVSLMKTYIENSSKEGETVFDPFMGAGSTGMAAISCGRQFIGCEIDPEFFDLASERLGVTQEGFDLI